jgi:uncharacterized protein (TIGR00369 family)
LTNKAQKGTVKATLFAFCQKGAKKTDKGVPVLKSPQTQEFEKIILERMSNASPNDRINKLMDFSLEDCSYEDQSLTLSFPVEWWMLNSKDTMHGGLICTAFDIGMGMLSLSLVRSGHTPTMQIDVSFVRPVHVDDRLLVHAKATRVGRTVSYLTGEARSQTTGKVCATATAIFFTAGSRD